MNLRRIPFWFSYLVLGGIPSLLFFVWVERNCALPYLSNFFGFPWISGFDWPIQYAIAFDILLLPIFGFFHTYTAQLNFRNTLKEKWGISEGDHRAVYMMITGLTTFLMIAFWQNTGVILWVIPMKWITLQITSISIFVFFMFTATRSFIEEGFWALMGAEPTPPELRTTGIYSYIRHPMYCFTLCAFFITPMMSLDRAIVAVTSLLYLAVGIPIEERKLAALFGEKYLEYQKRVPALFPKFTRY